MHTQAAVNAETSATRPIRNSDVVSSTAGSSPARSTVCTPGARARALMTTATLSRSSDPSAAMARALAQAHSLEHAALGRVADDDG